MEGSIFNKMFAKKAKRSERSSKVNNLAKAKMNSSYVIKEIRTNNEEIKNFLFTLGCYEGETVTVISRLADNIVIAVKDARYSIDTDLAKAIVV